MKTNTFAAKLRAMREHAGISAYQLAKDSGVSAAHISRLEAGKQEPSLEIAKKLAEALGIGLNSFA